LHLTHLRNAKTLRRLQLKHILNQRFIKNNANAVFICGDFNATMEDEALSGFLHPPYLLIDTFKFRKNIEGIDFSLQTGTRSAKIDHIFMMPINEKVPKIIDASIVMHSPDPKTGVKPSDHNGVLTIFNFENDEN